MPDITNINENIQRMVVPYKDIFTTVYFVHTPDGVVLFDTASSPADADEYILPALAALNIDAPKYIFVSHNHTDHAGGLGRLLEIFPHAHVVSGSLKLQVLYPSYNFVSPKDGDTLLDVLRIVTIPGHTKDSAGLLDTRTGTLLTGDCLQLFGIYGSGKWGANISLPAEHLEAVNKLRKLEIQTIAASHDYHPCGYIARTADEIKLCLDSCANALYRIRDALLSNPLLEDAEIADAYNSTSGLPTVGAHVVRYIRAAVAEGRM